MKTSAAALLAPAAAAFVCDNGVTPGPVHLQFAHFLDTAAFTSDSVRKTYRDDMLRVPNMLAAEFGTNVEYKLYYFAEKNEWGIHGCGWENSGPGFNSLSEFSNVIQGFHSDLPSNERTDRYKNYNSLSDVLYHSMKSPASGWIRSQVDSLDVPVVRIFSVATDVAAEGYDTSNLPDWPSNLKGVPISDCKKYDTPKMTLAVDEFPELGTYFIFLSQTSVDRPQHVPDVAKWYRDFYTVYTDYLGHVKVWSDALVGSGLNADQTLAYVRKAICDYWGFRPQVKPATGYTCDDGTVPSPVHIQFAQFLDTAAFPDEVARLAYRTDMMKVPKKLVDVFGDLTEYKLYYFNDKWDPSGASSQESCVYMAVGDGFLTVNDFHKLKEALFTDLNNNHLATRMYEYSSVSDAIYYSLKSQRSHWNVAEKDASGVPLLRIFSVGTDVAAWGSGVFAKGQWPVTPLSQPAEDCDYYDYVDIEDRLRPAVQGFPENGTYFIFLSQPGRAATPLPTGNTAEWYRNVYMQHYLGGVNGWSEEMTAGLFNADQTIKLVKKAACDLSAKLAV